MHLFGNTGLDISLSESESLVISSPLLECRTQERSINTMVASVIRSWMECFLLTKQEVCWHSAAKFPVDLYFIIYYNRT